MLKKIVEQVAYCLTFSTAFPLPHPCLVSWVGILAWHAPHQLVPDPDSAQHTETYNRPKQNQINEALQISDLPLVFPFILLSFLYKEKEKSRGWGDSSVSKNTSTRVHISRNTLGMQRQEDTWGLQPSTQAPSHIDSLKKKKKRDQF